MKTITDDGYYDVCEYNGLVYAASGDDPAIHVYETKTWDRIRTITACMSNGIYHNHTLRVTRRGITLACYDNGCIYVLDVSGALQKTHGNRGNAGGYFNGPHVCSVESDGSILVADVYNNRLQIVHDGEWRVLPLQPQPWAPSLLNTNSMLLLWAN